MDVRPKQIYEKSHPEGAKHAALFRKFDITKSSFTSILRATALALNGVEAVEPNPEFGEILCELQAGCLACRRHLACAHQLPRMCAAVQDLIAAAEGSKKVILACEAGGSLVPTTSFQYGKESRSLKASHSPFLRCVHPSPAAWTPGVIHSCTPLSEP